MRKLSALKIGAFRRSGVPAFRRFQTRRRDPFTMVLLMGSVFCLLGGSRPAFGDALPADVRPNHWAAQAVPQALLNGLLSLQPDKKFHGDTKVTRTQTAIALAKLARLLEENTWKKQASTAVSEKSETAREQTDWNKRLVSRYVLAFALTRMGNYLANGLPRPKPDVKDLGQSEILESVKITLPPSHPAYPALTYLANKRMISPDSPLLRSGDTPIQGAELSRALADMTLGLNDRLTSMNHDSEGNTPDANTSKKPKK
jgi:hypothetical protein